jgi:hypothetical protein
MKKILISAILICSLTAYAQIDSTNALINTSQIKFIEPSDSTSIGTPDGTLTRKEIGPAGGAIVSDDGRVELIFPAHALTANTTISIQPTTNPAPNGSGKAYQFEPSGTQFKNPVQIIFHYTDEEAEECPPDLMAMAMQDHTGKWHYLDYAVWDSIGKSLKGFIHHFSGLSNIKMLKLEAETDQVAVQRKLSITIKDVSQIWPEWAGPLAGEYKYGRIDINAPVLWYVNDIQNGNTIVGSIAPDQNATSSGNSKHIYAIFSAPQYLPKKSPAVIKADVYVFSDKKKIYRRARSLQCKINIYDEYKITIVNKGPSILDCGAELEDASSFTVKFYPNKKPEISNETNSEPKLTKQADCSGESRGGRSVGYTLTYDPGGCQGPVHVSKDRLTGFGMLINDHAPPDITIEFVPRMVRIMNGKIHYAPTPGVSTNQHYFHRQKHIPAEQPKDEPAPVDDLTIGNKIKFKANREHQEFTLRDDGPYSYQLIIEPIENAQL